MEKGVAEISDNAQKGDQTAEADPQKSTSSD
jgi:hypothetical protein